MLLMVQVKMNESIYAIFRTVRTYLSLALLIILKKKNKVLVGGGGEADSDKRYSISLIFLGNIIVFMSCISKYVCFFFLTSNAFEKECNQ